MKSTHAVPSVAVFEPTANVNGIRQAGTMRTEALVKEICDLHPADRIELLQRIGTAVQRVPPDAEAEAEGNIPAKWTLEPGDFPVRIAPDVMPQIRLSQSRTIGHLLLGKRTGDAILEAFVRWFWVLWALAYVGMVMGICPINPMRLKPGYSGDDLRWGTMIRMFLSLPLAALHLPSYDWSIVKQCASFFTPWWVAGNALVFFAADIILTDTYTPLYLVPKCLLGTCAARVGFMDAVPEQRRRHTYIAVSFYPILVAWSLLQDQYFADTSVGERYNPELFSGGYISLRAADLYVTTGWRIF